MQDPSQGQPPQYPPQPYYPPTQSATPYQPSQSGASYPPAAQSGASYPPTQAAPPPFPQGDAYTNYPPPPPQTYPPPQQYPPPQPYQPYGAGYPPPQKRPQQPLMWAILGVLAAVIIVGAIVAVVIANNRQPSTVTTNPPAATQQTNVTPAATQAGQPTSAPTQATSSPSGTHKIGDVVTLDGWQIVVNGAKISHGGQFDSPQQAGDVFLEIDVSVTNQTGQNQYFTGFVDFTLKDATGQKYDQAFVSDAPSPPDGSVQSGGKLRGTLAYEVAPTTTSFEFDFAPSLENNDLAIWNITVSQ